MGALALSPPTVVLPHTVVDSSLELYAFKYALFPESFMVFFR